MPNPPDTQSFVSALPRELRRQYQVFNRTATGDRQSSGFFLATRVPVNGNLQIPSTSRGGAGQMVMVDERVYLPPQSGVAARSVVRDIISGVSFSVLYVQNYPDYIEAWLQRAAASQG